MSRRLVANDIHIGDRRVKYDKELSELILDDVYDEIILNGDVVDLWQSDMKKINKLNSMSLNAINAVANSKKVIYVIGNHDSEVDSSCFNKNINFVDSYSFIENDKKFAILHGHQFDWTDKYLKTPNIWSSKLHGWIYDLTKFDIQLWLRKLFNYDKVAGKLLKSVGDEYKDYDVVIIGHTHVQEKMKLESNIAYNSGDIITNGTYIDLRDDYVQLKKIGE